jgi:type IV pilus assembly protein PilE
MKRVTKNTAYTLIEIVVVLAFIGVLVAFVAPTYHHYILKTHRYEARAALVDLGARLQNYHQQHQTYASATLATGTATDVLSLNTTPNGYYQLRITQQTDGFYEIRAIPLNKQSADDCGQFVYTSLGQKQITGSLSSAQCWE